MKTCRFLFFTLAIFFASTSAILQARTWTEASSGRTVDGEFVESDGTHVVIKQAGGRTFKFPIARLSEADQKFIKSQAPAKPGAAAGGGPLARLLSPASAKGLPITGEGKERKSGIEVTNNGEKKMKGVVVQMLYLKADGSIGKSVPHTHSGFHGERGEVLGKGKTFTIDVSSFFMEDDTESIDALVTEVTFDDDSMWPPPPPGPLVRNGEDPVSALMIGIIGKGPAAEPAVACYNHDAKGVKSVSYTIEYLDAKGEVLDTTSYGYAGGDDPILPSEESIVISGGDGPPEGAVDVKVSVTRLEFADGSEWKPTN